ncbi:MAG: Maf family protein [Gammaproteobacteria bacterium]|nr:Maf family protein [Gammaproteobacteria bacterium]
MQSAHTIILASTSPRRREILASLGLEFDIHRVDVDETPRHNEAPDDMVQRLARAKAAAADVADSDIVIGADTAVVLGDLVLGKPRNEQESVEMLLQLSGRTHTVMTGVAVRSNAESQSIVTATDVQFREIGRDEAHRYWQSGEPSDKAGSYGIQGLGGMFVAGISGSYSGVVGLPVFETVELLRALGVDVLVKPK